MMRRSGGKLGFCPNRGSSGGKYSPGNECQVISFLLQLFLGAKNESLFFPGFFLTFLGCVIATLKCGKALGDVF